MLEPVAEANLEVVIRIAGILSGSIPACAKTCAALPISEVENSEVSATCLMDSSITTIALFVAPEIALMACSILSKSILPPNKEAAAEISLYPVP